MRLTNNARERMQTEWLARLRQSLQKTPDTTERSIRMKTGSHRQLQAIQTMITTLRRTLLTTHFGNTSQPVIIENGKGHMVLSGEKVQNRGLS